MSLYFSSFPRINYNNTNAVNITLRSKIIDSFKAVATNFYSYTIKDGETADALAYDYYGDPNYVWIIYLCNNIIDPYYDWPLSNINFDKYIKNKYGSISTAQTQISYYKKLPVVYYINNDTNIFILGSLYDPAVNGYNWTKTIVDDDIRISSVTSPDPAVWLSVYAYTDELEQNENKRYMRLLDRSLTSSIDRQFKELMNA